MAWPDSQKIPQTAPQKAVTQTRKGKFFPVPKTTVANLTARGRWKPLKSSVDIAHSLASSLFSWHRACATGSSRPQHRGTTPHVSLPWNAYTHTHTHTHTHTPPIPRTIWIHSHSLSSLVLEKRTSSDSAPSFINLKPVPVLGKPYHLLPRSSPKQNKQVYDKVFLKKDLQSV